MFLFLTLSPFPFSFSLHIKNYISHSALHFNLISSWTEKDNPQSPWSYMFLGENKRRPIRCGHFWVFLCRVCLYQYCQLVHQKFWSIGPLLWWSHTCSVFIFIFSMCSYCFRREWTLFFWTFWDKLIVHPCVHGRIQNVSAEKKPQKEAKKKKSGYICSDFVLFIKTKNTDTEQSGQRIKSLFFILYIWKSRFQYVALLCCTNQMCLWHFSNLIYFTVLFCSCFLLHH